uniref:NADH-ubiquinone oxidoreductase chain 4 n=2 Tax=Cheumatopsyche TaxID=177865 RepID=A0A3G1NE30_9NEOP|nr:NADH dehydrogenase subunit 4 [Cheumatopsyche campyla]YP_009459942.1 NADH dehydrogenase subunit 4 [Cheumatopsyche analis]AUT18194.1 NADH dehydrogenase subunit 4 [Cheumatopsyche campyla]AUT18207.1 NADH dehydrogenase subunit 4 [Cheumatopsyche analis]
MLKFLGFFFFMYFFNYWSLIYLLIILIFMLGVTNINIFMFSSLTEMLGLDVLSFNMVFLSLWVCLLMLMVSYNIYFTNMFYKFYILNMFVLMLSLILTFSMTDLFFFFITFEVSILPVLFIIIGWGYQPERMQAGIYLVFYTMFGSLPLLMSIFYVYNSIYSMDFFFFFNFNNLILYFCLIFAFLIKMPMFLVHLWLPKAHVEGSIASSMILAGVMLKLGGYGMLRVFKLVELISLKFNIIWFVISLMGGVLISLMCLHLMDLKLLIAYSSVVHMSLVIGGIMTLNYWGFMGGLVLMIGHGLCSSGLFVLIGFMYDRLGSRSMMVNKGLINLIPNLTFWWFLFLSSNMAAPPSLNLLGEISLFISIISWSKVNILIMFFLSFFSACYSIYVFIFSQHGMVLKSIYFLKLINLREYLILFMHWVPLNILILKTDLFLNWF